MGTLGRIIIVFGVVLVIVGLALVFFQRIPLLGKLPGDFYFERGNFRFYFPIATSVILSLILTLILNIVFRLFNR